jgi:hypothetical protein
MFQQSAGNVTVFLPRELFCYVLVLILFLTFSLQQLPMDVEKTRETVNSQQFCYVFFFVSSL